MARQQDQKTEQAGARNHVAAVIVTYFPDLPAVRALAAAVRPQVERIVIVDNTPEEHAAQLNNLADPDCEVTVLGRNLGLAAAQNLGIDRARELGQDFVVLFDQDSMPAPDMVQHLIAAWRRLDAAGARVAAVGPRWHDRHEGADAAFVRLGIGRTNSIRCRETREQTIECDTLVASGCLIPMSSLEEIGPMEEGLFIDQVDVEWGVRAQARGFRLFGACDAILYHGIGERTVRPWFARGRRVPVHAPLRDYYLVRNIVAVFFMRRAPWRWRLLQAVRLPGVMLVLATQMPPRLMRLRMIVRGLIDALRGRLGPASFG